MDIYYHPKTQQPMDFLHATTDTVVYLYTKPMPQKSYQHPQSDKAKKQVYSLVRKLVDEHLKK
jgi:hypothetical protein